MGSFEAYVDSIMNGWLVGKEIERIYGITTAGQRFALVTTSALYYAVRLIVDEDHREHKEPWTVLPPPDRLQFSEHLTRSGATERVQLRKRQLETGYFADVYKDLSPNEARARIRIMPQDCIKNPDKYLKPGDLVQTDFLIQANHEGIYIGNGKVIHMSGHGDGKAPACARIGDLCPNFCAKETDTVRVVVYRLRFRRAEDIVAQAKEYAAGKYRLGEYDLLRKNCQHFATLCVLGYEVCGDVKTMLMVIGNTGIVAIFLALALL